jgi:spore germination protein YaaH
MLLALAMLALIAGVWLYSSMSRQPQAVYELPMQNVAQAQPTLRPYNLFNGKVASLGWIVGRDCQRGIQAYLKTAATNPDAALVGTGWVDPTTGKLINGAHNICMPGSLSMDNVVQLIHSKGGMAYLTITMETDGSATSWTSQQQSEYIAKAASDESYINYIIHEVQRANYDGVIMDLEGADPSYPNMQGLYAAYNQRLWNALKPLHKYYGISLVHKTSDHDAYYDINGFANWSLLGRSADFIIIQAIDQSYETPGPTVSIPYLKQLLAYALQTMPQMLPRIVWELPLYGATWHLASGQWVYDGQLYEDAQQLIASIPASEINASMTNLDDPIAAHTVYTDASGVEHSLWFQTAQNLYNIIAEFKQILRQTPQFGKGHLQIAVWYTATWEPAGIWTKIDPLLPAQQGY